MHAPSDCAKIQALQAYVIRRQGFYPPEGMVFFPQSWFWLHVSALGIFYSHSMTEGAVDARLDVCLITFL